VLSDFGVGANQGVDPIGVAVQANGAILVVDLNAGTNSQGALFEVDPATGSRTVLSDFGVGANQGVDPRGVAVQPNGTILVVDAGAGTNGQGALFVVFPDTGNRTVLSDFGVGANQGVDPRGVAVAGFALPPACLFFPSLVEVSLFPIPVLGPNQMALCARICTAFVKGCEKAVTAAQQCIRTGLAGQALVTSAACAGQADAAACKRRTAETVRVRRGFAKEDLETAKAACQAGDGACLARCLTP
jgi:hypothetical protein